MKDQEDIKTEEIKLKEESLEDLSVADDQADEAKGGTTKATPKLFLACATGQH